jgi:hypothetical protein
VSGKGAVSHHETTNQGAGGKSATTGHAEHGSTAKPTPSPEPHANASTKTSSQAAKNASSTTDGTKAAATTQGRVNEPVPGLYDSIDPDFVPPGWRFEDQMRPHPKLRGWVRCDTNIVAPDGTSGWVQRSYDPQTKTLVMENAFLNDLPSWIDAGKPLKSGKGTPTVAYLTMRQMKKFGVHFGEITAVKMSTIQNIEAVMQLEHMKRNGIPYDQGIAKTHSVTYATTSIQQSGQTIVDVKIDTSGAWPWRLSEMMEHFEMPESERQALFSKYGLKPEDAVLVNYDIIIDMAPHVGTP